ncbi:MAG: YHS domain protein [Ignavibacteriae bacterium]|nr:YHS domain protein [Ignavibacteriota bacterium]
MIGRIFSILFYTIFIIAIVVVAARYTFSVSYLPLKIHSKYYKTSNLAVEGYDMVFYFKEKDAYKGNDMFYINWDDFNWLFKSSTNSNLFKARPERYAPQFGGYCSYLVTKNIAYPCDPKIFHVYKGKLYLFSSESKKEAFISDIDNQIDKASLNWNK